MGGGIAKKREGERAMGWGTLGLGTGRGMCERNRSRCWMRKAFCTTYCWSGLRYKFRHLFELSEHFLNLLEKVSVPSIDRTPAAYPHNCQLSNDP